MHMSGVITNAHAFALAGSFCPVTTMSTIDKHRVAAVRKLEQLGYTFAAGDCMHRQTERAKRRRSLTLSTRSWCIELMHWRDVQKAPRRRESLAAITDAIAAHEAVRWPLGRTQGGNA
jgi:hypothetical protein